MIPQGTVSKEGKASLISWLVLALLALLLAWGQNRSLHWAQIYFTPGESPPGSTRLALGLSRYLYGIPPLLIIAGWFSRRFVRLQARLLLVIAACLLGTLHVLFSYAVFAPYVVVASGYTPRQLPSDIRQIIEDADTAELFSILPFPNPSSSASTNTLRGYPVLGSVQIKDRATHKKVVQTLLESIDINDQPRALCFSPRHALSITHANQRVDLLICYQCKYIEAYLGEQLWEVGVSTSSKEALNQILIDASIPLAPEPTK